MTKPFIIKTDYKNLIEFLTTKELNQRQVRWVEILVKYYFEIKYIKGMDNIKADILSKKVEL
jgi:RNase H-like domain found in reverse transcriptase